MATPVYAFDSTHVLSDAARALHDDTLAAHAVTAEMLLGLRDTTYEDDAADQAALAVAYQVNHQVALPTVFRLVESESKGRQSITYRKGASYADELLDGRAQAMVDALTAAHAEGGGWATVRSARR